MRYSATLLPQLRPGPIGQFPKCAAAIHRFAPLSSPLLLARACFVALRRCFPKHIISKAIHPLASSHRCCTPSPETQLHLDPRYPLGGQQTTKTRSA